MDLSEYTNYSIVVLLNNLWEKERIIVFNSNSSCGFQRLQKFIKYNRGKQNTDDGFCTWKLCKMYEKKKTIINRSNRLGSDQKCYV